MHAKEASRGMGARLRRSILFKNRSLLVLNKWPGLLVQGADVDETRQHRQDVSLLGSLRELQGSGQKPRLLHRLDRNTSGVLVLARDATGVRLWNTLNRDLFSFRQSPLHPTSSKMSHRSDSPASSTDDALLNSLPPWYRATKRYLAVCVGVPKLACGVISGFISETEAGPSKSRGRTATESEISRRFLPHLSTRAVRPLDPARFETYLPSLSVPELAVEDAPKDEHHNSKWTVTKFRVLSRSPPSSPAQVSLVEFVPLTGRTHQLRIHATQALGTPVLGDTRYSLKWLHEQVYKRNDDSKHQRQQQGTASRRPEHPHAITQALSTAWKREQDKHLASQQRRGQQQRGAVKQRQGLIMHLHAWRLTFPRPALLDSKTLSRLNPDLLDQLDQALTLSSQENIQRRHGSAEDHKGTASSSPSASAAAPVLLTDTKVTFQAPLPSHMLFSLRTFGLELPPADVEGSSRDGVASKRTQHNQGDRKPKRSLLHQLKQQHAETRS